MRPNTPQYKHLRDRIRSTASARRWYRVRDDDKKKVPPEVRRARLIVKRWDRKVSAAQDRYTSRLDVLAQRAEEALLFKEDKAALAAVVRFEKAAAKLKIKL